MCRVMTVAEFLFAGHGCAPTIVAHSSTGEPTFSATPLSWTHAGFVRLADAIAAGHPVDTPPAGGLPLRDVAVPAVTPGQQ
jgi:hypothetical protein